MKNIIVLTSGGDSPGMNAAIRAVVRAGHFLDLKIFGSLSGFQGLVDESLIPLEPESVANCIQHGGTILKADRCMAFFEKSTRDKCRQFLKRQHIDGIIVIGGNGSLKGAALLASEGGPAVIGIPGTIDNDIMGTEYTIGFDTACNTALQAIDKIRDTASSHNRNFLVEVMGRSSGFLALDVGIAGGAEIILTPEFDVPITMLASTIQQPKRRKQSSIIVVAEAEQPGRSVHIAAQLEQLTQLPYRVCIVGHTQRGGSPTTLDRKMASEMGFMAVKHLHEGVSHKMIAFINNQLTLIPLPSLDTKPRILTTKNLIELNNILCI
ncbi:MAG: 6-phosphofructokinase [Gammaproteobacteria bacterium]|nr:6-phosphofructokinase [Gammaproteobacteria bacterium]